MKFALLPTNERNSYQAPKNTVEADVCLQVAKWAAPIFVAAGHESRIFQEMATAKVSDEQATKKMIKAANRWKADFVIGLSTSAGDNDGILGIVVHPKWLPWASTLVREMGARSGFAFRSVWWDPEYNMVLRDAKAAAIVIGMGQHGIGPQGVAAYLRLAPGPRAGTGRGSTPRRRVDTPGLGVDRDRESRPARHLQR